MHNKWIFFSESSTRRARPFPPLDWPTHHQMLSTKRKKVSCSVTRTFSLAMPIPLGINHPNVFKISKTALTLKKNYTSSRQHPNIRAVIKAYEDGLVPLGSYVFQRRRNFIQGWGRCTGCICVGRGLFALSPSKLLWHNAFKSLTVVKS